MNDPQNGHKLNGNCDPQVIDNNPTQTKSPVFGKLRPDPSVIADAMVSGLTGDQQLDAITNHSNCQNGNSETEWADDQMDSSEPAASSPVVPIADYSEDTVTDPSLHLPNGDHTMADESSLMDFHLSDNRVIPETQMDIELKNNGHNKELDSEFIVRNDIKTDFTETDETVTVFLYIKDVVNVNIDFFSDSIEVKFKTKDIIDSNTTYVWRKNLHGKIYPEQCSHKLSAMKIELILKKIPTTFRWDRLDPTSPSSNLSVILYNDPIIGPQLPSKLEASDSWQPVIAPSDEIKKRLESSPNFKPCDPSTSSEGKELVLVMDEKPSAPPVRVVVPQLIGFTGLQNLGNTCFMNSVIQCLSNTDPFRDYFVSEQYLSDINHSNPLGSGGVIARVFADTLSQLWAGIERSIAPHKLKDKMGDRCPTFSNYLQQDAQEFCVFFLDALHEDLNRIRERPVISDDKNEESNEPTDDQILADKSWKTYGLLNDSIVTQLFYGQYKSKLVCPICGKVSVTFDPFVYLSLPLPKPKLEYEVYFFKRDPNGMCSSRPTKYTVKLAKDSPVQCLLDELSRVTKVKSSRMRCIQSKPNGLIDKFSQPKWILNKPETGKYLLVFELMDPKPEANEDVSEFSVIQRICQPVRNESCAKCDKSKEWDNVDLKACKKCYRVNYCDKQCQSDHWPTHRKDCVYRPEPIAVPFVISVAKEAMTYRNLCAIIYSYARHSVKLLDKLALNLNEFPIPPPFKLRVLRDMNNGSADNTIEPESAIEEEDSVDNIYDTPLDINNYYLAMDWINDKTWGENFVNIEPQMGIISDTDYSSLSDSSDDIDLEECLQLHTQPEKLTSDNPWYCPKCKESREATKQITLWRLPHFLIIQLKRFSFRNILWREKLDSLVSYPVEGLDMSPYYVRTDQNPDVAPIYDLYGVVNHYGGLFGGHYTAYAKTSNDYRNIGWRCFDDSHVEPLDRDRVVSRSAYMLFYKLRD